MNLEDVIGKSWVPILQTEFDSEYMRKLSAWLAYTRQSKTIYPDGPDVFRALKLCPYGQVKVVIIGKEPYYQGNADGLAFSYKNGIRQGNGTQSLDVIFDEIERDCYAGFNVSRDYQLDYLAKQGVLLLNAVLTVFKGQVGSHRDVGWQQFTTKVILTQLLDRSPKVFMVWGNEAKELLLNAINSYVGGYYVKFSDINGFNPHLILSAYHPAADLHSRDSFGQITARYPTGFTGCGHFSKANAFLQANQIEAINWFPTEEPHFNYKFSDDLVF